MDYIKRYTKFLNQFLDLQEKVKVVFDCSDGSTGIVVRELFENHPHVDAVFINDEPNGDFPAHGPNPLSTQAKESLAKEVQKEKADLGVVFDGDGDRVFFFDEKGDWMDSYRTFSCIKDNFKPPYILDVRALAALTMPDVDVIEERVGRYFIINTMKDKQAELGVEYSGHYYFKDFFYSDSGILAAIHMINYVSDLKAKGKTLESVLKENSGYIRLEETNFTVKDTEEMIEKVKERFKKEDVTISTLDGVTVQGEDFALNMRASATEPLVRFSMAASHQDVLEKYLKEVKLLIH